MPSDERFRNEASDPTVLSLIVERIDAVEKNLSQRLDTQDRTLARVEGKVDTTNGRVTTLEKARERAQGVMFAYSWVPAALTAVLGSGLTILIMALTGAIH